MSAIDFHLCAWESWGAGETFENAKPMPLSLRRRVTPVGQKALNAACGMPDIAQARFILSSRHGEFSRTLSLLEAITKRDEVSPADFTLSVHHALIGLLSIATKNRKGHIAVAAGAESFCFGLMEAAACLKENPNEPVILIHFDEPLPEPFTTFNDPDESPIALALALKATGREEHITFANEHSFNTKPSTSHAMDFIHFLKSNLTEGFSASAQRQWRWARHGMA